ncbi:MAG: DNA polymerase/3'-5' exonuclease PolX [Verrucomicrobia bacterium]|nr:DNA polymerase/3'-5' exonuclease PolX [Verrucomicrobiota bacterium]
MTADQMSEVLRNIARLLELKGENTFKVRAYNTGAEIVENFPGDIVSKAAANELEGIKGLGDALQQKLHELATTGKLEFYDKLKAEFPEGIMELFDVQGLGPKKIVALHQQLGVGSIADLKRVCENGAAAKLPGFGEKTAQKLLEGIAFRQSHAHEFRQDQVAPIVAQMLAMLKEHPDVSRAEVAGSYRRAKETVHDLDFLVAAKTPAAVMNEFVGMPGVKQVLGHGETKSSVLLESGVQCDLRAVKNDEFAAALVYFTGSKEHNIVLRQRALERGWSLNEYGFTLSEGVAPSIKKQRGQAASDTLNEEADVYRFLDLDFIEPELRENTGEVAAAESGTLPKLVELSNLRGCFHNHTTASDGKATLREMAEAAHELGWQYLGIADHSQSSVIANGLDEKRLRAQIKEIRQLNEEFADKGLRLFAGSEVDILKDGSLDFDDGLLGELDYVVASVHNIFTLSEAEQTKRIIRAMENPHVTMLGHVTGRLLLERPAYAVNIPAIIKAAAETGTIIEINANPWRLDLDWRWWKVAVEKGVKCSINPDAHSTRGLQDVYYGVRIARKGWLTKRDVVNCLPLVKMEEALRTKRERR